MLPFVLQKGLDPTLIVDDKNRIICGEGSAWLGSADYEYPLKVQRLAPRAEPLIIHVVLSGDAKTKCLSAQRAAALIDETGIVHKPFGWTATTDRNYLRVSATTGIDVPRLDGIWKSYAFSYIYALPADVAITSISVDGETLARFDPPCCKWSR